jgi:hypothetical protein
MGLKVSVNTDAYSCRYCGKFPNQGPENTPTIVALEYPNSLQADQESNIATSANGSLLPYSGRGSHGRRLDRSCLTRDLAHWGQLHITCQHKPSIRRSHTRQQTEYFPYHPMSV